MVKKQKSKKRAATTAKASTASGLKAFINEHLVLILGTSVIVLSVVIVFLFWGINQYNTQQAIKDQRKQFDSAEASLDALYAQIVQEVGQPTKFDKDKSCSYASAKLDQGRRSCGIHYYLKFGNITEAGAANRLKDQAETVLRANPEFHTTFTRNIVFNNQGNGNDNSQSYDISLSNNAQLRCYLSADFLNKDDRNYPPIENTHTELAFACSGDALSEFYPVKD